MRYQATEYWGYGLVRRRTRQYDAGRRWDPGLTDDVRGLARFPAQPSGNSGVLRIEFQLTRAYVAFIEEYLTNRVIVRELRQLVMAQHVSSRVPDLRDHHMNVLPKHGREDGPGSAPAGVILKELPEGLSQAG